MKHRAGETLEVKDLQLAIGALIGLGLGLGLGLGVGLGSGSALGLG